KPMRLEIRWRNGDQSTLTNVLPNRIYEVHQASSGTREVAANASRVEPFFADVSSLAGHVHVEDSFDDWARQPMLPRRLSRLGPGVSWYDVDGDGWEDLIVSAGRGGVLAVFTNDHGQSFHRLEGFPPTPADQGAVLGWSDSKGNRKLLVAASNYEMPQEQESEISVFSPANWASPQHLIAGKANIGPVAMADINGDSDLD